MCGRFLLTHPGEVLARWLDLDEVPDLAPRYNIAPSQPIAVLRRPPQDGAPRRLESLVWGLVPFWAKDRSIGQRMINARSETAADKPAFRQAIRRRRCLVPASGFYEWAKVPGARKRPIVFRRADGGPFAIAGIWERWTPRDAPAPEEATPLETCALLTTAANQLVGRAHHRMPVVLRDAEFELWLDPDTELAALAPLWAPREWPEFEAQPVARTVNDPRYDGPRCLDPPEDAAPHA